MTSGVFGSCSLDIITIGDRQRKDITDLTALKASLTARGQIHPIVLTRDFVLVAGFRRYSAAQSLGWTNIHYQFVDSLDPEELELIELEENVKRENLSWLDEARAVERIHRIQKARAEANIEAWDEKDTANSIGMSQQYVADKITAIKAVEREPALATEPLQSRVITRYRNAVARQASSPTYGDDTAARYNDHIQYCSFLDWATTYDGPKFNLLHCDFPYGINYDKMGSQAGINVGRYKDSLETYETLLKTLAAELDRFMEESAHLVFWFSMQSYTFTFNYLSLELGFDVNAFPLVWLKSDGVGIIPDPSRGPRRIYETAFLASRGDRRIVRPRSNAYSGPTSSNAIHPHEKPEEMLDYFFEMLVDEHTSILDPTCGSGSAIRAAKRLGATRLLGLEINEEYVRQANAELNKDE